MKYILIIFALLLHVTSFAQDNNPIKISGKVIDASTKGAMPFANVVIFNPIDDSQVVVVTSNDKGYYIIDVDPGTYNITFEFAGYKKSKIEKINSKPEKNILIFSQPFILPINIIRKREFGNQEELLLPLPIG
ncbi:MAG: hypothetical protein ACI8XB_000673 [Patiriisocius sp.]|jgi:hypothetical protein